MPVYERGQTASGNLPYRTWVPEKNGTPMVCRTPAGNGTALDQRVNSDQSIRAST